MRDRRLLLALIVGGYFGTVLRAALADAWAHDPSQWPWATFTVNVAGAAALGYFVTRLQERLALSTYRRPLLGTGLCGGLTTFSTMELELLKMLDHGHVILAAGYLTASIAAGLLAVFVTTQVVRRAPVHA